MKKEMLIIYPRHVTLVTADRCPVEKQVNIRDAIEWSLNSIFGTLGGWQWRNGERFFQFRTLLPMFPVSPLFSHSQTPSIDESWTKGKIVLGLKEPELFSWYLFHFTIKLLDFQPLTRVIETAGICQSKFDTFGTIAIHSEAFLDENRDKST